MSIVKRGKYFHYRFTHQGREYTKSTGLDAKPRWLSAAKKIESEAYHALITGQGYLLDTTVRRFSDAVNEFLQWVAGELKPSTVQRYETSFSSLLVYFADRPLHTITSGDIESYKTWRRTEHKVKEVTLRHDLHNMSGLFQWAMKKNYCQLNPVRSVEVPSDKDAIRIHVLSAAEEQAYFAAAAKHQALYDVGRLMINQGCRPEEILRIRIEDVDLERGELSIPRGKTNAARRTLTLMNESRSILARRIADVTASCGPSLTPASGDDPSRQQSERIQDHQRRSDDTGTSIRPIASSDRARRVSERNTEARKGTRNDGQPVQSDAHSSDAGGNQTNQGAPGTRVEASQSGWVFPGKHGPLKKLNNPHARALKASGTAFVLYSLRHTCATRWIEAGVDDYTVAKWLGHSGVVMVWRYAHPTREHEKRMAEQVARYRAALEPQEGAVN